MSVNTYTAYRRFERFLIALGFDPEEPPDDRKTLEDMARWPGKQTPDISEGEAKLIATVVFDPEKKTITYVRPGEEMPNP